MYLNYAYGGMALGLYLDGHVGTITQQEGATRRFLMPSTVSIACPEDHNIATTRNRRLQ